MGLDLSRKGLARRMQDAARADGADLRTTHVGIGRWLDGGGIEPAAAKYLAAVISTRIGRRLTPADLGFSVTLPAPDDPNEAASGPDRLLVIAVHDTEGTAASLKLAPEDRVARAALSWMLHREASNGALTAPTAGRMGMRDVAAIRTAAQMFMQLDFLYGGGHGRKALRHYFRAEVLPTLRTPGLPGETRRALFSAAAEVSQLLAWTAYDVGEHAVAQRYFMGTLELSQEIDDRMFGGRILANLSHQANYLGQHALAVQLAQAAQDGSRGKATPRAMALFAAHEARGRANLGDTAGVTNALRRAEESMAKAGSVTDPRWLSYVDDAEILGEAAHCFRDLGQSDLAVDYAQAALDSTAPEYARTLVFCRLVLAAGQLRGGEQEQALSTAISAIDDAENLHSVRVAQYLREFRLSVGDSANNALILDFDARVSEVYAPLRMDSSSARNPGA